VERTTVLRTPADVTAIADGGALQARCADDTRHRHGVPTRLRVRRRERVRMAATLAAGACAQPFVWLMGDVGTSMSRDTDPLGLPSERAERAASDAGVTDLLLSVAGGDEVAFGELYDAVSGRVFGLARRITQNRALAEEVMQEVMVEVWRTAPRFDAQRRSGIGWILMLAHRRAVDRVRRDSTRQAREVRDAAVWSVQAPIDDQIMRDDEWRQVNTALAGLTDLQREAIRLAYYEGYTYREVAQQLGIPEGTAKSRLRDGIRQLRANLGGGP
jgi:RNA polymerase sigma-70 factor, ECF subfamily